MKSFTRIARQLTFTVVAAVALGAVALPQAAQSVLAVGQTAPAFELQDLDGKTVSLAAFRGKTVVLEWINPNCPVSRDYAERKVMSATAAAHPAVVWLAINSTNQTHGDFVAPAAHKAYNQKNGIAYPVLYDSSGDTGRAYEAKTTPHMFVIDPAGKVVYNGAIDSRSETANVNYVDAALDRPRRRQEPRPVDHQAGRLFGQVLGRAGRARRDQNGPPISRMVIFFLTPRPTPSPSGRRTVASWGWIMK